MPIWRRAHNIPSTWNAALVPFLPIQLFILQDYIPVNSFVKLPKLSVWPMGKFNSLSMRNFIQIPDRSVTPLLCPRYCSTTLGGKVTGANLVPESVLPRGLPPESASCIFPPCCVCTSFPPRLSTFFFCSVLTCSVLSCFVYYLENAESLISRGLLSLRPCLKAFAPNDING